MASKERAETTFYCSACRKSINLGWRNIHNKSLAHLKALGLWKAAKVSKVVGKRGPKAKVVEAIPIHDDQQYIDNPSPELAKNYSAVDLKMEYDRGYGNGLREARKEMKNSVFEFLGGILSK